MVRHLRDGYRWRAVASEAILWLFGWIKFRILKWLSNTWACTNNQNSKANVEGRCTIQSQKGASLCSPITMKHGIKKSYRFECLCFNEQGGDPQVRHESSALSRNLVSVDHFYRRAVKGEWRANLALHVSAREGHALGLGYNEGEWGPFCPRLMATDG